MSVFVRTLLAVAADEAAVVHALHVVNAERHRSTLLVVRVLAPALRADREAAPK